MCKSCYTSLHTSILYQSYAVSPTPTPPTNPQSNFSVRHWFFSLFKPLKLMLNVHTFSLNILSIICPSQFFIFVSTHHEFSNTSFLPFLSPVFNFHWLTRRHRRDILERQIRYVERDVEKALLSGQRKMDLSLLLVIKELRNTLFLFFFVLSAHLLTRSLMWLFHLKTVFVWVISTNPNFQRSTWAGTTIEICQRCKIL